MSQASTIDDAEIEKFQRMADEWWDPNGKFRPLHRFNPVRLKFIRETAERVREKGGVRSLAEQRLEILRQRKPPKLKF